MRGLNHFFGSGDNLKQVLYDVDLDVHPGQIVIMTGPSGSGKTTLLTLVGGLRSVQDGSLQVLGQEMRGLTGGAMLRMRRLIGFIFQAHNLFDALTARRNVRLGLELHAYGDAEMDRLSAAALERLGLGQRMEHKPQALSGGQKQRVAVARAIVHRPKVILADEPTAALDKKSGRDVVELLQELAREERATIVLVTHDNRILDVADRIVNLLDGRIASNVDVKRSVEICEFLKDCPVFAGSLPGALAEVSQMMRSERHAAGSTIFQQGDPGESFYLIRRGSVDVVRDGGAGAQVLKTLGPSEFFGETALLRKQPRNATIVAREDVEVYALAKADFEQALSRSKNFEEQLLSLFYLR